MGKNEFFIRVSAELVQKNKGIVEPVVSLVDGKIRCELKEGEELSDLAPLASIAKNLRWTPTIGQFFAVS